MMPDSTTKPHAEKRGQFYFFRRCGSNPGFTVSKSDTLPAGDCRITEYIWQDYGYVPLWFVDADKFTAKERQAAYRAFCG